MKIRLIAMLAVMLLVFDASAKVRKSKKSQKETTEQQSHSLLRLPSKVNCNSLYKGYWNYEPACTRIQNDGVSI